MPRYLVTDALSDDGIPTLNLANLGCTTPWGATVAATATTPTPATSIWLEPASVVGYRLTAKAQDVFKGVFTHPPIASVIRFGYSGSGNSGITIEGVVTLHTEDWNGYSEANRIQLLCHEHTHLPQENVLTMAGFLARYAIEYRRSDNYVVPPALAAAAISTLEPTFTSLSYTMDQMAERCGNEGVRVAKAKGYIP